MTIVLSGANSHLLSTELQKLTTQFISVHGDLALERIDAEESSIDSVLEAVQSLPFLSSKKMVVLRGAGANKEIAEQVETIIERAGDTTELIIYDPKIDKRGTYYKTLKNKADLREFGELDERGLAQWLIAEASSLQAKLGMSDALYLVQRVGANQLRLGNELQKLALYDPSITRATIDLLTEQTPQSKIFELVDAAFAGNHNKASQLYEDQRAQNVEPQQILAMLSWQLQVLAVVSVAGKRTTDEIAQEAKLNPFVVRKAQGLLRSISSSKLKQLIAELLQIDIRSKTSALDLDDALGHYIISMAEI
jgi:DNA polymerase-3 subunit delta